MGSHVTFKSRLDRVFVSAGFGALVFLCGCVPGTASRRLDAPKFQNQTGTLKPRQPIEEPGVRQRPQAGPTNPQLVVQQPQPEKEKEKEKERPVVAPPPSE